MTTLPCCPARPVLPARCKKSIVFRGSSTMKTCLMSEEKSSPRERIEVVTITCGTSFTSDEAAAEMAPSLPPLFCKNPSRCLFDPRPRCSLWLVIATFLMPCSERYVLNSTTLVLLLQNKRTLDKPPDPRENAASSAQIFLIRRRMSANLLPPVQLTCSV